MTNPIMPGIEKLAEKYGIKSTPNATKIKKNDFYISNSDKNHYIGGIKINNENQLFALSKKLLNIGKRATASEWNSFEHLKMQDNILYKIPSLPEYFSMLHALMINKDGDFKKRIEELVTELSLNFYDPIITSTIVKYHSNGDYVITHNYKTPYEYELKNQLPSNSSIGTNIKDFNNYIFSLTGFDKKTLEETIKWATGLKTIFILDNNSPKQTIKKYFTIGKNFIKQNFAFGIYSTEEFDLCKAHGIRILDYNTFDFKEG